MDRRARMKHLLKSVLGVDVDAIAARVLAQLAVERAVTGQRRLEESMNTPGQGGVLVVLPDRLARTGKRRQDSR